MKTFRRLLTFLWPFRWRIALAILLGSLMFASSIVLFGMAAYLIAAAALAPLLIFLSIPIYVVQMMGIVRAVSRYFERLVSHNTTFRLLSHLRVWAYSRIEPLAPAHLLDHRSGDVLTRLVTDIEELQNFYLRVVSPIVIALMISLLTFSIFTIFSTGMAWVAVAFLIMAGAGLPCLSISLSRGLGKQQVKARAELNTRVVDGLQGMQDGLAFGYSHAQLEGVVACDSVLGHIQRRMASITGLQIGLNDLLMNTAMLILLILAIPLVSAGYIDGVYLGAIGLLILASFEAVQPLASAFQWLGHSRAAAERVFAIADASPPVSEATMPQEVPANTDGIGSYHLSFEHVHFAYHQDQNEILKDISFDLCTGHRVAVVGPSGAGKSTLVRLVLRFWDPDAGTIRFNGQDIRGYRLNDLRSLVGVVSQDTYIFSDTIRANLLLARPEASEIEIEAALEQAQLTEFVRQLPQGLKTQVGEQGMRLSGGERQRLAIARAFLKNAPILLLDEVTANLDAAIERALLDTLDELTRGRATLYITHRLLKMERMNEILVLERGSIIERGTHEELLAMEGLYRQLFDIQQGMVSISE